MEAASTEEEAEGVGEEAEAEAEVEAEAVQNLEEDEGAEAEEDLTRGEKEMQAVSNETKKEQVILITLTSFSPATLSPTLYSTVLASLLTTILLGEDSEEEKEVQPFKTFSEGAGEGMPLRGERGERGDESEHF